VIPDVIPGFEETDADRAYAPTSGCGCEDCGDERDLALWEAEVS
jgi:hypothetical protein